MKAIGGFFVAAVLAAAIVALPGGSTASGQEGGKDVLTIGMMQGIDSMNPVRGVTVAAFEAWNMVYPTLTDKAAKDFGVIPGLATKWEGSEDGKTWTYTLRPGMKWSDGQPLTAEDVAYTINRSRDEAWLNHSATTGNLTATATSPTEVVIKSKVPDPKLPTMDVYIVPKHIYEQYDAKALTKWNGQTDVGGGHVPARRVQEGPVRPLHREPELLGRQAVGRRGRDPEVQQRGRDGRRAQARRGRLRPERPRGPVPQPPEGSRLRHAGGPPGRLRRVRHQHGRRPQEAAPGAARPEGPRGDRPRDRQEDDRRPRAARDRRAGRGGQPVREPGLDPGDPRGPAVRLRPREVQADPRGRGLQGHGRRRHPRDAGRRPAAELPLRRALRVRPSRRGSPSSSPAG